MQEISAESSSYVEVLAHGLSSISGAIHQNCHPQCFLA